MSDTLVLERLPQNSSFFKPASGHFKKQRIYILPTRHGIIFSVLLLTMLLGAINYNNSMAYLLTFLLSSLFLVCILHTHHNLSGILIKTGNSEPVFVGEPANFPITFTNYSRTSKVSIAVAQYKKLFFNKKEKTTTNRKFVDIPGSQKSQYYYPVKTFSRGIHTAGRINISTTFPLGLFNAWSTIEHTGNCVVYPKPIGQLPLPSASDYGKEGSLGEKAGTDDFTGFRNYRPGDSIKNIDWKIYSRGQPLQVKKFTGEAGSELILSWDQLPMLPDIEDKLSQLCQWIIQAESSGLYYGLKIPGQFIQPDRGQHHQQECLSTLACFGKN